MFLGGGMGGPGRLTRAIRRSSPEKSFGRRSGGAGHGPRRLIDRDLRARRSRSARIRDENRRRQAAIPVWIAVFAIGFAVVAGILFAMKG